MFGDPVIPAALVVRFRGDTSLTLLDERGAQHPLDGAVERARQQSDLAVCPALDLLHDGVAVALLIGHGEQDAEHLRAQRELIVATSDSCSHCLPSEGEPSLIAKL